jgi:hypothetical protein
MRGRFIGLITAVALVCSLPVLSQEKKDKDKTEKEKAAAEPAKQEIKPDKDMSKLWVDLSGVMYLEWAYQSGFKYTGTGSWTKSTRWGIDASDPANPLAVSPVNYSIKNNNTFRMQRAYLTLKKQIGDMFSIKVTTDIDPNGSDFIYLKYGFVQFYKEFGTSVGSISLKAQLGKIGTPVIGITDYLNDLRWLGPNYLNISKLVLNGKSYDDSADLGGLVSLNILKLATLEYSLTNGEGYKADNNETYGGKAHTLLVSANPVSYLKELYVNFYGRWEDTNKDRLDTTPTKLVTPLMPFKYSGIDDRSYMGCGVAWYSDLIKAGANFFVPETHFSRTILWSGLGTATPYTGFTKRYRIKSYLVDSWINVNLGAVTPAGILLLGRCAYGKELKSLLGNQRQSRETLVLGGGLGYQFNQYFRMAVYYETIRYTLGTKVHNISLKDPTANNNVYIKVEAKY